jgi:hypothetical protein
MTTKLKSGYPKEILHTMERMHKFTAHSLDIELQKQGIDIKPMFKMMQYMFARGFIMKNGVEVVRFPDYSYRATVWEFNPRMRR